MAKLPKATARAPDLRGLFARQGVETPENRLILTGQVCQAVQMRTTPAGIPVARFVLAHRSRQHEAGQLRDVECRVTVVASGAALTRGLAEVPAGTWLKVEGFLSRAGYRAPASRVELHAIQIQAVPMNG